MKITDQEQLEERMSRPTDADIAAVRTLEGDVLILGVGGKMGPSLARLIQRSADAAKKNIRVMGVARFTDKTMPDAENVIFMAARKFGTTGSEHLSWALNTQLPALVAERYRKSRIVCFSSGNVYPLVPIAQGGATRRHLLARRVSTHSLSWAENASSNMRRIDGERE